MQGSAAFHADFCAPPSRWAATIVGEAFNIPDERLCPVPNGVPAEFLNYHRKPEAQNGPVVFFGRLSKTKGVDTLVEAFSNIQPDKLPECHIIGRGEMKEELLRKVREYGLSHKIVFKPWMTHEELGEALSGARMSILPSREENFSLAILSSMCVGTPTISTKVGGTPEIITDQENGLLVPPDNPAALSKAIEQLLENPNLREQLGAAGSTHIRNNLTWDDACAKFEKLYEEALGSKNSR